MSVIYFDTETTGLRDAEICQLSYVVDNGIEVYGKNYFFCVHSMNPAAQAVHGFSIEALEVLSDGLSFADRIDEFDKDFQDAELIVAHNASFDISMMQGEYRRLNREFKYNSYLCTMRFMTPFMQLRRSSGGGFKYPSLSELTNCYIKDFTLVDDYVRAFFGAECRFHDARYDAASLYLAVKNAQAEIECLKEKVCSSL
jgi:DNA polymerase-3 subunit epsilon